MREGPGKVFAEPRTHFAGERAWPLHLAPEVVRILRQPEGFEPGRTARPVRADQHEVAQVRHQHQPVAAPVAAHLVRLHRQPGVSVHALHLDDAPLRDLPCPRPVPLNLLRGVERVVGMAGTLVGPLQNAEHLRLERAADRADQVGQRRVVRPLPGPATRCAHAVEVGEVGLGGGGQGFGGGWALGGGRGVVVRMSVVSPGDFGRYYEGEGCRVGWAARLMARKGGVAGARATCGSRLSCRPYNMSCSVYIPGHPPNKLQPPRESVPSSHSPAPGPSAPFPPHHPRTGRTGSRHRFPLSFQQGTPAMPGKQQRPEKPRHDASYKNFFTHSQTVADTLRLGAGELARRLDFATLERLPASFVTEPLGQRHADMLWRIGFSGGGWVYILILLEFQSSVDRRMALRMMNYTNAIWMRLGREDLGPRGEYPLVLPIVIYNGKPRWTAATDVGDLVGPVPEELLGYRPRLRYLLIEIRSLDLATLPPDNVLAMIAKFEQAPTAEALEELAGSLADRPEAIEAPELAGAFAAWIMHVLTQRFGTAGRELQRRLMS